MRIGCCLPGGSFMPEGVAQVSDNAAQVVFQQDQAVIAAGFDYTESSVGTLMSMTESEIDELAELKKQGKLHLEVLNSFIPPKYKIARGGRAPELEAFVEEAMSRMARVGIEYVVFGSGGARTIPEDVAVEEGEAQIDEFLKMCDEKIAKYGVVVVIEPLNHRETNQILTVAKGAELIRRNRLKNVKLLVDGFHAFVEEEPLSHVSEQIGLIRHVHIAETPERTYPGQHGGDSIRELIHVLRKAGYPGRVTAECHWEKFADEVKPTADFMKEVIKDTIYVKARRALEKEPVFVPMEDVPEEVGSAAAADGRIFPAQKTEGGVIVILDGARDEEFELLLKAEKVGDGVVLEDHPERLQLDVLIDGKLFTRYGYGEFIKPYLGPMIAANGDWMTRLDPTVKEHPHHRSVFVAVGDVNGIDFWNENPHRGEEHHQGFEQIVSGNAFGRFTAKNVWTSEEGIPQIDEVRTFTFYAQTPQARTVDLEVTFTASYGDVTFGPTKEAGPLGIRVNESMRADRGGSFNNSYGGVNEAECWGRAASWCDYHGEVNGNKYGIAAFDHEDNERYPATWHIRNYGLFAANNLYFKGGFDIKAGESITYKYRMIFYENEINTADRFILYTKTTCGK